jgi:hypothetical protein
MTQPRLVVPGDTLMITRSTLRRHRLFRPDSAIRRLYLYTLALCARQFGILVHGVGVVRSMRSSRLVPLRMGPRALSEANLSLATNDHPVH